MSPTAAALDMLKWLVLALAALTIAGSYYSYDAIAPVADLLRSQRHFSQSQIASLNAVFSLPNIPLSLVGGIVIDRIGAARASFIAALLSFVGCVLTAIGDPYALMVVGRLVFGVGTETLYIALLVGLSQWFAKGGSALSIALFFSMARVGSYFADISPRWAASAYASGWQPPLLLAAGLTGVGVAAAFGYWIIDQRYGAFVGRPPASERFRWSDLRGFWRSFWDILWLNVLFASVFFPFRSTFSIQFFQDVKGLTLGQAGLTNSWVFFAAIIATPLCGLAADRFGRRATLLMIAAALLPLTFIVLGATQASLWVSTTMMGVSFSVIPAVIWPSTAMLVEKHRIGTAFGLINMLQSLGLTISNSVAGALNDHFHAGATHPAGYAPMLTFFGVVGGVALFAAVRLWIGEFGAGRCGLEDPRIG
jgi:MFS family permease